MMIVARSGIGKSEAFSHMAFPIHEIDKKRRARWNEVEGPKLQAEQRKWEKRIKVLEKKISDENIQAAEEQKVVDSLSEAEAELRKLHGRNHPPKMITEDVTIEALAKLLMNNNEVIYSLSSDARKAIDNLFGRYSHKDSKGTDESLYLKSYSWEPFVADRLGRDEVNLNSPCLTLLWMFQPDLLEKMLQNEQLMQGGFMPRALIIQVASEPRKLDANRRKIPTTTKLR